MGEVVCLQSFREKKENKRKEAWENPDYNSLEWAENFLEEYYNLAMYEWSMKELFRTIEMSKVHIPTGAEEDYTLIYNYRKKLGH